MIRLSLICKFYPLLFEIKKVNKCLKQNSNRIYSHGYKIYCIGLSHILLLFSFLLFTLNYTGQALVSAVTSGSKRFFLGTDSAPHDRRKKECSCGCAGIYNAPVALSAYAKVFEQVNAMDLCSVSCECYFCTLCLKFDGDG